METPNIIADNLLGAYRCLDDAEAYLASANKFLYTKEMVKEIVGIQTRTASIMYDIRALIVQLQASR